MGSARASLDLVLPRSDVEGDVTVWDLIASRFGPEVAERLVEPLLGSIHAGLDEKTERSGHRTPDPGCWPCQPEPPARSAGDGPLAAKGQ